MRVALVAATLVTLVSGQGLAGETPQQKKFVVGESTTYEAVYCTDENAILDAVRQPIKLVSGGSAIGEIEKYLVENYPSHCKQQNRSIKPTVTIWCFDFDTEMVCQNFAQFTTAKGEHPHQFSFIAPNPVLWPREVALPKDQN